MPRSTPLQDRQARGHPAPPRPTHRSPPATKRPPAAAPAALEPLALAYAEQHRIDAAARVLGSWEALAMHASAAFESIPQTRLRFEKILLGVEDEGEEEWMDEVEVGWVEDEGGVMGGKGEGGKVGGGDVGKKGDGKEKGKGEKDKDKGKGKETPKKGARESAGRRDEGTFGRLRGEREERRRER
ncbi:hypothetical protein MMC17_004679 [Xylographa soralifera]|nr:hypothetical protein [Xylographa soralifera]